MKKPTFGEFCEHVLEWPWFDEGERPRTFKAIRTLWERVPARDLDRIPLGILVFAPSPRNYGQVNWFVSPAGLPTNMHHPVVYLAPALERHAQSSVNSTVAHEFAHAILGHARPDSPTLTTEQVTNTRRLADLPDEVAADALTAKWGFRKAYDRRRKHGYRTGRRATRRSAR